MAANPPVYFNPEVYRSLPSVRPSKSAAWLMIFSPEIDEEQKIWGFLVNPSILRFSRTAEYGEQASFASKVGDRQYGRTTGRTLSIPNIILNTWHYQKSLMPLIEGINSLMEVSEDKFSPPILSFIFGKRRFAPCVLTEINWDESTWHGGTPTSINLSMVLQEIPNPGLKRDARTLSPGELEQKLTDRQRKDASDAAKKWLQDNSSNLDKVVSDYVKSNRYYLETDPTTGEVTMLDRDKKVVGIVGKYDGNEFDTSDSTIPKKQ